MKILCVCNQGNNRSVQFMHLLKYWGHDTLAAGTETNSIQTLEMLCEWADIIITTDKTQKIPFPAEDYKVRLLDVGPDTYPRPFNKTLLAKAKKLLDQNREWLTIKKQDQ